MKQVTFTFKNGYQRKMLVAAADVLTKRGLGTYQTRDMADMPKVQKEPEPVIHPEPVQPTIDDGLDQMDKAELHALAKERGLQLHHMLGADKVRAALRGESQE